jgi:hypothetical protein
MIEQLITMINFLSVPFEILMSDSISVLCGYICFKQGFTACYYICEAEYSTTLGRDKD